jgi:dTMP kinase
MLDGYTPAVTPTRETPTRGWFITIEGPEGSGKTTHAARLEAHLREAGLAVVRTREPGGTFLGERIRDLLLDVDSGDRPVDPLADALLFNAARRQLVEEVIRPALAAGTTVICARFADSTLAYQGHGAGLSLDELRALERVATGGLRPDLTVLLDLTPEAGLRRKSPDDRTRFELAFDLEFHRRVRDGFLAIAAAEPDRFVVVDAGRGTGAVWEDVRRAADRLRGAVIGDDEPERAGQRIQR